MKYEPGLSRRDPGALHRPEPAGDRRGRATRHLAGGVDAVLSSTARRRWRRRSAGWRPRPGRRSSSAPTSSSRRRGAIRRSHLQLGGARRARRPIAAVVPEDAARAVRRVRAVQAAAVLRVGRSIEAVSDFSAGTEAVVFDAGRTPRQRGDLLRVGLSVDRRARSSRAAASCSRRSPTTPGSAVRRPPISTSSRAPLRAVEQGRYVVRAANTGISGAVDPYGRVLARTRLFEPTAVTVDVRLHRRPHDLQPHRRRRWSGSSLALHDVGGHALAGATASRAAGHAPEHECTS